MFLVLLHNSKFFKIIWQKFISIYFKIAIGGDNSNEILKGSYEIL